MPLESAISVLEILVLTAYGGAFLLFLAQYRGAGFATFTGGWVANACIVAVNWTVGGHPPFGNMYHVMVFLGLCFLPLYLLLRYRHGLGWLHAYFALASVVAMVGALSIGLTRGRGIVWQRMPALQSPWFVPHVVSYMISYALATVAFVLTMTGVFKGWKGEGDEALTPSAESGKSVYAQASHTVLRIALPFMTFGLLSGALWAEEAWGRYWSWDPKETWSLITWTLYMIYLHCRRSPRLRHRARIAQILAFAALLTTFLLVNLLPRLSSVLHSYV